MAEKPPIVARMDDTADRARMYLGDGAYVSWDGVGFTPGLWLRTERLKDPEDVHGGTVVHEIYLDAAMWRKLVEYVDRVKAVSFHDLPEEL